MKKKDQLEGTASLKHMAPHKEEMNQALCYLNSALEKNPQRALAARFY